jgi:DHA1 family tetracycline resistance protein-like MFS transporter
LQEPDLIEDDRDAIDVLVPTLPSLRALQRNTVRKPGLIFIFVTVVLDMLGIGIIIPSLPDLIRRYVDSPQGLAQLYGYFIAAYAVMQFLAAPLLGALSDLYGRRAILLGSLFVAGLSYIAMAHAPNLEILFASRILAGIAGSSLTVAMAYIADISDEKNRAQNFGLIGGAFGLGFIIGPALGGILGAKDLHYPFYAAALMNFLNFLFGLFILPESLPQEKRRGFEIARLNPLRSLQRTLSRPGFLGLFAGWFLFQFAAQTHGAIWTIYTQTRYSWTTAQVGLSLTVVGALSAISQGLLTKRIVSRLGEIKTVSVGIIGYGASFVLYGLASEGWMLYAILVGSAVFWVAGPALQSVIAAGVPASEQGELQGSIVSTTSLASIVCPVVSTQLFSFFTSTRTPVQIPGMPYFFGAAAALGAFLVFRPAFAARSDGERAA